MMVKVIESHKPFSHLLIRLCGIIGGLFATSGWFLIYHFIRYQLINTLFFLGMIHALAGFFVDVVCCRYSLGKYQPLASQKREGGGVREPSPSSTASLLDPIPSTSDSAELLNNGINSASYSSSDEHSAPVLS